MAPLSSQLLRSRLAMGGDAGGGAVCDRERHSTLNATWNGMGSKRLEAAEAHGAARPKSVHEILAQARATVAGPVVDDALVQQKQPSRSQPERLQKIGQEKPAPATTAPTPQQKGTKSPPKGIAAANKAAVDVSDFVKRVESGALLSVQEKARARAERLVDQRDPRHGTKRKGAGKALDAAAVNQQQMHHKVTTRLQERILTELKRINHLCPEDPHDVTVTGARRDENAAPAGYHNARDASRSAPDDVAFLEATLRHLRTHHQRLSAMKTTTPDSRERSKAAAPPRVAVLQPSQQRKQDAARVGSTAETLKPSAAAGKGATTRQHAAARRIQHEYRVRLAVRKVKARYEGKLRATRRELHKLKKAAKREMPNEPSPAAPPLAMTPAPVLKEELEALQAQVAEEKARADAAEASVVRWQESEADNLAQIAGLREELYAMQKLQSNERHQSIDWESREQLRSADAQAVETDAWGFEGGSTHPEHCVQVGVAGSSAAQAEAVDHQSVDADASGVDEDSGDGLPADVLQMLERAERGSVQTAVGSC